MIDRLDSFVKLKKAAYALADERGFFKKGIQRYDMSLNLKERAITEHIIKSTWAYHKNNGINISNTEENNLIFTNCIYAGMYAAKYIGEDVECILSLFDWHGITSIEGFVENNIGFLYPRIFRHSSSCKGACPQYP